jgi:hypothetical protein
MESGCPCRLPTEAGAGAEAGFEAGAGLGRLVVSVAESSRRAEWEAVGDLVRGGRRRENSYLVESRLRSGTVRATAPAIKWIESNEMETEHKGDGELKSAMYRWEVLPTTTFAHALFAPSHAWTPACLACKFRIAPSQFLTLGDAME